MLTAMKSLKASIKPLIYHYMLYVNALVWDFCQDYMELICVQATDVLNLICFKLYNASLASLKFSKI